MRAFWGLLKKDLIVEWRQREAVATLLLLSALLTVVSAFAVNNSFLDPATISKIAPGLFWMVFIVTASVAIGKTTEYDTQYRAIDGVILSGVPLHLVYLAKMCSNFVVITFAQFLTFGLFVLLLNLDIQAILPQLLLISCLVLVAYSSLLTLLSGIASSSRIRSLLLPLISLPLLFPLFFCAVELSGELFATQKIALDSAWISLLVGLDIVYFTAGLNLYEYVIRD
jgi:heme exporter protein B